MLATGKSVMGIPCVAQYLLGTLLRLWKIRYYDNTMH